MTPGSILPRLPSGARILFIRLRSIGDIVLLTPGLRLLKEWRPDLQVSLLVESRFRELVENNPDVNAVLESGEGTGWDKIRRRIRIVRELRRKKFSLCVNLHGGPTSTFFTRWCGARWKAGFEHFRSRRAYRILVPDARRILGKPDIHTAEHQASALFWLGLPRREVPAARIFLSAASVDWWRAERQRLGIPGEQHYAVLHPAALYATKQWAPENLARLGLWLEDKMGLPVVYSCGPGESPVLNAVERACLGGRAARSPLRRIDGAGLGQFAAALAGARLFVGNDSGPAHMATALGRPSVVIFGSSSSVIWGPWPSQGPWRSVQNFYECNPCPGDRCYRFAQPECILSVTLEQVQSAAETVLSESDPKTVTASQGAGG